MTLIIQKPTGAKLNLAQTYVGIDDPDAAVYVAAVEAADGQSLETATKVAIHSFVKGCKADGIWPAIKASCILAGARTLAGALVPLVGTAPTNVGGLFVSGDYNRETGLVGDGSTKYLDTNRNANAQGQDNFHFSVFATNAGSTTITRVHMSSPFSGITNSDLSDIVAANDNRLIFRNRSGNADASNILVSPAGSTVNFMAANRSSSSFFSFRRNLTTTNVTSGVSAQSFPPINGNMAIFARPGSPPAFYSNARLAFYSIGESLDLALLDARVTTLINAFAAAIP
jgi:hypothetical protein